MQKLVLGALALALAAALALATRGPDAGVASSHREAPLIAEDPSADNTDLYAFRSPDKPDTITIISNVIPAEDPAAGPNWYRFSAWPAARYNIHIDRDGDARADVTYRFRFRNRAGTAFLATPFRTTTSRGSAAAARRSSPAARRHRTTSGRRRRRTTERSPRTLLCSWTAAVSRSQDSGRTRSSATSARSST